MLALLAFLAAPQPSPIDRLAWLAGCWESASGDRTVEEQWMAPRAHTMLGMGRTVRGGKLLEHELVVVREEGERLAYEAHPSGQKSAVFLSRELGESRVVFENATHDFPQRVGYERKGATLLAWIEGARDGKVKRIEFPYRRVACP
jgi:hypothetical protein